MLADLYDRYVLKHPAVSLLVVLAIFAGIISFVRYFQIDVSGDALVMQQDEDLQYYREINRRYAGSQFVVVTYTPPEDLLSDGSLDRLSRIREDLRDIKGVTSVLTVLDVPLLKNPPGPLKEVQERMKNLEHPEVNIEHARKELRNSPLYSELLVSPDLTSSAIQVNLKENKTLQNVQFRRSELLQKEFEETLSEEEEQELERVQEKYERLKRLEEQKQHARLEAIRKVVDRYRSEAEMHIGGVPVISDNISSYIEYDIMVFGIGILLMLVLVLWLMFRRKRWVILPIACCMLSGLVMMGLLGILDWDVTVVSANFISLQLIFTMSLVLHILVRYWEYLRTDPGASHKSLVRRAGQHAFVPCLFASLSTIAGFSSLIASNILPVINFGWIMTTGVLVSLIVTFMFLPIGISLTRKPLSYPHPYRAKAFTDMLAKITDKGRYMVIAIGIIVAGGSVYGMSTLKVENSFVNYFHESSEVYQGLRFIDRNLGGTTPLEVIVNFGEDRAKEQEDHQQEKPEKSSSDQSSENDAFEGFEEYGEDTSAEEETYWYTASKLEKINQVHDYLNGLRETGKVRSLATLWKVGKDLNQGKPLDNLELQILFNGLPDRFRQLLVKDFSSVEESQVRIEARIQDTLPNLDRDQLLARIKNDLPEQTEVHNDQFRLTGLMVLYNNMLQSLYESQVQTIGLTIVLLLFMFLLLFQSIRIALIAIFPDLIAGMMILGIMGFGGLPLDIMTMTIVAISVGIAVDDTIHYLHRFEKEFERSKNYIEAMYRCHGTIGNAMTYTTIAITMGFSILVFSKFIPTVYFGILTALAMMMALISSMTLLPALVIVLKPFGPEK